MFRKKKQLHKVLEDSVGESVEESVEDPVGQNIALLADFLVL